MTCHGRTAARRRQQCTLPTFSSQSETQMGILIPVVLIFFACLIIWRACDGFETASEYIGKDLSEGVRGGTINAISSSLPELFTTLIALFVLDNVDGFSIGLGTTAGSALFNGMIIPALCIFAVVGTVVLGTRVNSINVSTKVIFRDGLSLIFCEIVLILLINGNTLYWWQGLILMGLYGAYLTYMLTSMKSADEQDVRNSESRDEEDDETRGWIASAFYWLSGGPALDLERFFVRDKHRKQIQDQTWNGWPLLLCSATIIGLACFILVEACEWLGTGPGNGTHASYSFLGYTFTGFGIPTIFVAVIFASMATSVPDAVMSIRDAKDGDYDDAVANALGSNIFDICFALGFPLFIYTILNGPITLSPAVAAQSAELRFLLLCLTVLGFFTYLYGKKHVFPNGTHYVEMKRGKAALLALLYLSFAGYVAGLSFSANWANSISESIRGLLDVVPTPF